MRRIINLVLVVTLILSVIPVGVMADDNNGEYTPDWSVALNGDITVVVPDDYGAVWHVGTDTGRVYHLDRYGNEMWDDEVVPNPGVTVSSLVVGDAGVAVLYSDGTAYLIDHDTGDVWQSYNSTGWSYDIVLTSPVGGDWYVIASYTGITDKCYITRIDENRVYTSCIGPGLIPGTISVSDTALIGALSGSPSTLVSIPVSSLNSACKSYDVAGIPISSLPAYSTLSAYQGYLYVDYTPQQHPAALQEIRLYRTPGTNSFVDSVWDIYLPNLRQDYGDIRFYQGNSECEYYIEYLQDYCKVWVEHDASIGSIVIVHGNSGVGPGGVTDTGTIPFTHLDTMDNFTVDGVNYKIVKSGDDFVINADSNKHFGGYLTTKIKIQKTNPVTIKYRIKKPSSYDAVGSHTPTLYLVSNTTTRGYEYYGQPITNAGILWKYDILSGSYTDIEIRYNGNGTVTVNSVLYDIDTFYQFSWDTAPITPWSSLPSELYLSFGNRDYGRHPAYYSDISVSSLPHETITVYNVSVLDTITPVQHNKVVSGTITETRLASTHAAIQTSNRLYLQELTGVGSFDVITDMLERVGTANGLDITDGGTVIIEGRGNSVDIFQHDGTRVGTYNAGLTISEVYISEKNGLYALASSEDTKYYIFSKDESSMWYLLYTSPTGDEITASVLTAYGDYVAIARGSNLSVFPTTQKEIVEGTITIRIYDRSNPYADGIVTVLRRDSQGVWGSSETFETDGYGTVVISAEYGKLIKIIVGQDIYQTTLIPTPAQAEYVIYIPTDLPLRAGANYRSWYDSVSSRLYYSYFDTRGKTHVATFEIIRNSDNEVVHAETFTLMSGDTGTHTGYYQIPGGYTNTSYRVHLTATGSPSFTNTWHQWISGESGVASLPVELSKTLKIGIFMVLLLFVGGIFSYFSGPHGAVVVSLMAAMLVFWGWLPISPAVVMLCVVWAFLGLLGRTSVG